MNPDIHVFDGPGLPLLLDLEAHGFDLAVRHGELWIKPVGRLSPEQRTHVQQHRDALVTLVRCCDNGVQERLVVFKRQRQKVPTGTMPAFVFQPDTPYTKGVCFSCGAALSVAQFGRCWRCSLAWRMAAEVMIPANHAAVYDRARVVA